MEVVAAPGPAPVNDAVVGEAVAAYALAVGTEPATDAPLAIPAVEVGCRCFSSLSNSVTRVNKLCTTSRNCFTSSADAGAALFACARPAGHHARSARHEPVAHRSQALRIEMWETVALRITGWPPCEWWLIMRRLLSRLAKNSSDRVVASGF